MDQPRDPSMAGPGGRPLPVTMQRSTRFRRLIVAFLVVLALAVAVRFARATEPLGVAEAQDQAGVITTAKIIHSEASHATMCLPDE